MAYDYEKNKHLVIDSTGRKLTTGLFHELIDPGSKAIPVFFLSDWKRTYVDIADPTDYRAAMELIGNWEHWEALLASKPFAVEVEKWRREVDAKLESEAIHNMKKLSRTDKGTAAAKWLAEKGYQAKTPGKRGRKAKEEPEGGVPRNIQEDAKRLGFGVINGGK